MPATNVCDGDDRDIECDSLWSDLVYVTTRAPGISSISINVHAVLDGRAHPDPNRDWSDAAFEWDPEVTFARIAQEDNDAQDGGTVIDM